MKLVMFLLAFTAIVGFNALCQELIDPQISDTNLVASSEDAVRPVDVTRHIRAIKQRAKFCPCAGKSKAQRGCHCKMYNYGLSQEKKIDCLKAGIKASKKCKIYQTGKNKATHISTPV